MLGLGYTWNERCGVSRLMWGFVLRATIKSHVTFYYIQGIHLGNGSSGLFLKQITYFQCLLKEPRGVGERVSWQSLLFIVGDIVSVHPTENRIASKPIISISLESFQLLTACWHGNMTRVMMSKPYELMIDLKLFGHLSHFKFPLRGNERPRGNFIQKKKIKTSFFSP